MSTRISHRTTVPESLAFQRLDHAAATLFPQYSRARLQGWIKSGELSVNGSLRRQKDKVLGGEEIRIEAMSEAYGHESEDIALDILYEDDAIAIVNKPAGLVVHPGAGNPGGTLLNALLHRYPQLDELPRAGIVHRLDKDTSGLLVVARTLESQTDLVRQLQARTVKRVYEAVVYGVVERDGVVDAPIERHPVKRVRMSVRDSGREAVTHYRVVRRFTAHTHLELSLETGRTHQIRVHLQHIKHPLVGDPAYGGTYRMPAAASEALKVALKEFPRQALHARRLELDHPETGERVVCEAPLAEDIQALLATLEAGSESSAPATR